MSNNSRQPASVALIAASDDALYLAIDELARRHGPYRVKEITDKMAHDRNLLDFPREDPYRTELIHKLSFYPDLELHKDLKARLDTELAAGRVDSLWLSMFIDEARDTRALTYPSYSRGVQPDHIQVIKAILAVQPDLIMAFASEKGLDYVTRLISGNPYDKSDLCYTIDYSSKKIRSDNYVQSLLKENPRFAQCMCNVLLENINAKSRDYFFELNSEKDRYDSRYLPIGGTVRLYNLFYSMNMVKEPYAEHLERLMARDAKSNLHASVAPLEPAI